MEQTTSCVCYIGSHVALLEISTFVVGSVSVKLRGFIFADLDVSSRPKVFRTNREDVGDGEVEAVDGDAEVDGECQAGGAEGSADSGCFASV